MVPVNASPTTVVVSITFNSTPLGSNPTYSYSFVGGPFSTGPITLSDVAGSFGAGTQVGSSWPFSFAVTTLYWGNYTYSTGGTYNGSAVFVLTINGAQLTVHSDCSYTFAWTSVTGTLTIGAGSPITILTASAGSTSAGAGGYDERRNIVTLGYPTLGGPGQIQPPVPWNVPGTWNDYVSLTGGFTPSLPVLTDASQGGPCYCVQTNPLITGTNTSNLTVKTSVQGTSVPGSSISTATYIGQQQQVTIHGTTSNMLSQELGTNWSCDNNGINTHGEGLVTSPTSSTSCESSREYQYVYIFATRFTSGTCSYSASNQLVWPTKPPCPAVTTNQYGPEIVCTLDGELYMVYTYNGDLWCNYSPTPDPNWTVQTRITTNGSWSNPAICVDAMGQVEVRATRGGTYRIWSNDHAATWNPIVSGSLVPEVVDLSATQSKVRCDTDGNMLEMSFVPDSGTTGPGTFSARLSLASGPFGSPFVPLNASGTALRSDGSGFGHDHASEGPNRWWLAMVQDGDTTPSVWNSGQDGKSWTES
jgi:hypothetical protein